MFGSFWQSPGTSSGGSGSAVTKSLRRSTSRGRRCSSKDSLVHSEYVNRISRNVDPKSLESESIFATVPSVMSFNEGSQCYSDDLFATAPAVMCTNASEERLGTIGSGVHKVPRSESRLPRRASSRAPEHDAASRSQSLRGKSAQRNKEVEKLSRDGDSGGLTEEIVRKASSEPVCKTKSGPGPKSGLYRYEKIQPPPPLEVEKPAPLPSLGTCPRSLWKRKADKFALAVERFKDRHRLFRSRTVSGSVSPSRSTTCSPSRRSGKSSKETTPSSFPLWEESIDMLDGSLASEVPCKTWSSSSVKSAPIDVPSKTVSNSSVRSTPIDAPTKTSSLYSLKPAYSDVSPSQADLISNVVPERTPLNESKLHGDSSHKDSRLGSQASAQHKEFFIRISPRSSYPSRAKRFEGQGSRSPRRPLSPGGRRRRRRNSAPSAKQSPSEPVGPEEPSEPPSDNRARKPSPDRGISPPPVHEGPGICRGFSSPSTEVQPSVAYLDLAGEATPRTSNDAVRLFGLEAGFGVSDVRAVFMRAAKHWHPDRPAWVNCEASERELATAAFRRARVAYDLLSGLEYDGA